MLSIENINDPMRDAAWDRSDAAWDRSLLKFIAEELRDQAIERDWCGTYEDRLEATVKDWVATVSPGGPEQDWARRFLKAASRGIRVNVVATISVTVEHSNYGLHLTGKTTKEGVYWLDGYTPESDLDYVTLDDLTNLRSGDNIQDFVEAMEDIHAGDLSCETELSLSVNFAD